MVDAAGTRAIPGAVLLDGNTILASGSPQAVGDPGEGTDARDLPGAVVLPGLVNAHAHLDLSGDGLLGACPSFPAFVERVRSIRDAGDEAVVGRAVERGVALSLGGGTALVGDIAGHGSPVPARVLRAGPLGGVSYLEVFGTGPREPAAIEAMRRHAAEAPQMADGVRFGLSPHAPYSCGIDLYRAAAATQRPLATHLAETSEEVRFMERGDGPIADMLRRIGVFDESAAPARAHPVDALAPVLAATPIVAAHVNCIADAHLDAMARWPITVVYCPRAAVFLGHPPHRYRAMRERGIRVALGTDSLLCLDTPDRISVLDEMRLLHRRDGADPADLLSMATVAGAGALAFDEGLATLQPGPVAGVLACAFDPADPTDPLVQVLEDEAPPEWILPPDPRA